MARLRKNFRSVSAAVSVLLATGAWMSSAAAEMPPSARKIVADLKVSPEVLRDWEAEQAVPQAWLAGAKKTGRLRIIGTWTVGEFRKIAAPFRERYPFVDINYVRGSSDTRTQAPLIAFKQGRFVADVLTGMGGATPVEFAKKAARGHTPWRLEYLARKGQHSETGLSL